MAEKSATVTCAHCRVAMPADNIGMADRCLDPSCPLTPRNRGPWFLTEAQAAARDAAAVRYVAGIVERCVDPEMPAITIATKLLQRGITADDWSRIRQLLEINRG